MNIVISNRDDRPIYEQITAQIKEMIISGKLKSGRGASFHKGAGQRSEDIGHNDQKEPMRSWKGTAL